jgi:hypothetical protein
MRAPQVCQLAFAGAPLLEPGSVTTHPVVVMALLLFDGEIVAVRAVRDGAWQKHYNSRMVRGGSKSWHARTPLPSPALVLRELRTSH